MGRLRIGERTDWLTSDDATHDPIETLLKHTEGMRLSALNQRVMFATPMELVPLVSPSDPKNFSVMRNLYWMKIARAYMPTVWSSSSRALVAMPFQESFALSGWDPEFTEDIQGALPWSRDMDNKGMTIDELAFTAFTEAMYRGVCYMLFDNPSMIQRAGNASLHPYVTLLPRRRMTRIVLDQSEEPVQIGFSELHTSYSMNGSDLIENVIMAERLITDPRIAWPDQDINALRVQVYENRDGKVIEREDLAGDGRIEFADGSEKITLSRIFIPVYGEKIAPYRGHSPFIGTASIAEALFRTIADIAELARTMSYLFVHETGVSDERAGVGVADKDKSHYRYHTSTHPAADMAIVESTGAALTGLMALARGQYDDIIAGHRDMYATRRGGAPITATQAAIEGHHAVSDMERYMTHLVMSQSRGLHAMRLLAGLGKQGSLSLPTTIGLETEAIKTATDLYLSDKMTAENYFPIFLAHGYANPSEFDLSLETMREENDMPPT